MFTSVAKLKRKIGNAKVISFDVFDTSVQRQVDQPRSLFKLMQPQLAVVLGDRTPDFHAARAFAEERAALDAIDAKKSEISLQEIYKILADRFGLGAEAARELCQHEIRAEIALCRRDPFIHSLYRHCIDAGKTVVFLSDMYLPQSAVADILQNCGYAKYDALLVSSEFGKTKWAGTLYDEAMKKIGVGPKGWLHIGDNYYSDFRRTRRRGIASWHYLSPAEKFRKNPLHSQAWSLDRPLSPAGHVVKGMLANRLARTEPVISAPASADSFWEDFGYSSIGPLYAGLSEWLVAQIEGYAPHAVYFLSRDGFIVKKLFEMFRPGKLAHVESHYLYASRRASKFAAIRTLDSDTLAYLMQNFSANEVGFFLSRIGLDPQQYADAVRKAGFRCIRERIRKSKDLDRLTRLLLSLAEPICERAEAEREVMLDYLVASGLSSGRRVALFDVGWRGNSHISIQKILEQSGHDLEIRGYYLGNVAFNENIDLSVWQDGYLFRYGEPLEYRNLTFSGSDIVELPFSSPEEGSLIRMERTTTGGFAPVQQTLSPDETSRRQIVARLQAGAMQFVTEYLALKQEFPDIALTREDAINQFRRVMRRPTTEEARRLGDVPNTKDFGEGAHVAIAPAPQLLWLLESRRTIRGREASWTAGTKARRSRLYQMLYRLRMRELADL
jgi:predicted HAD superfamily hydrolase